MNYGSLELVNVELDTDAASSGQVGVEVEDDGEEDIEQFWLLPKSTEIVYDDTSYRKMLPLKPSSENFLVSTEFAFPYSSLSLRCYRQQQIYFEILYFTSNVF